MFTLTTAQLGSFLIPNYIYPSGNAWSEYLVSSLPGSLIIASPSSGPGASQNSDYVTAINTTRPLGIKVIGYVFTSFAGRLLATVEADIDSWYSFYQVDGIFFDQVSATSGNFSYYQSLYNYVKGKDTSRNFVALNPGVPPLETYMTISDTCTILENTYAAWLTANPYASWMLNYNASKLAMFVYSVPNAGSIANIISQASLANVGRFFLTDQSGYTVTPSSAFWNMLFSTLQDQSRLLFGVR